MQVSGVPIYNDGLTLTNDAGFSARANGQYVDGGLVRNKLHRGINPLGLGTSAKYHGKISGAGIYNHYVRSKTNSYFAGQLGLEYRKDFERGNLAARIGVRHAFGGEIYLQKGSHDRDLSASLFLRKVW